MPDAIFAEPKLAEIYDLLESPDRRDLVSYLAIADEFSAHSVIDLGCGTGNLACRLAARGFEVVGIDPAVVSLDVAKRKAEASRVRWIMGTAAQLKGLHADLIHHDWQCRTSIRDRRGMGGNSSGVSRCASPG